MPYRQVNWRLSGNETGWREKFMTVLVIISLPYICSFKQHAQFIQPHQINHLRTLKLPKILPVMRLKMFANQLLP